jgi:hypothetical protein
LIALACHPESRSRAVRSVHAEVTRKAGGVAVSYVVAGRIDELKLPTPGMHPLWKHTCCELFVARHGGTAYHEFNFSPSGDWAAYAFTDYRQGGPIEVGNPGIVVRASSETLELKASVAGGAGPLLLALAAVIEERAGRLSYWALRHAPGKPDFHHRDAFALELG